MKKVKLSELVTFVPGINPTRAEKQFEGEEIDYYTQADFDLDFRHEEFLLDSDSTITDNSIALKYGDVIISHSLQLATMVGASNVEKVPTLNFLKVKFNDERLDKGYFIYLFNEFSDVRRQKEKSVQGSGSVQRITTKELKEIVIPLPDITKQKKIGKAYIERLKIQSNLIRYNMLLEQFVNSVIEENLKEKR